ncbi:transposase domain-containing protein [Pseudoruegeria sp. HB172150]|uniref:transposase domain-containing protein n=1 Tax=Pseudoruegeria sp. HB172150 TaxID=2721164 RepID=UPI0015516DBA|nr:transposase domain-containing protein [Pseudoruegeria sp. HB172150]
MVPLQSDPTDGRKTAYIFIFDLPAQERLAYLRRQLDELRLDPGSYDDAAHEAFLQASPSRRERAEGKAAVARMLVALGPRVCWAERLHLVHERFGEKGHSKPRLKALLTAVKGVDPINYAPALLDEYTGGQNRAEVSEEAWRFFLTTVRDAAPEFPLKQAWRDVRDVAKAEGWNWPSWSTVYRRWQGLSAAERLAARQGRRAAVDRLTIPAIRDKTSLNVLDVVSLDGRMLDLWTDFGDGRAVRPVVLILLDVASGFVLDWELAPSENAAATVRLIKRVCEKFGIFDMLYTDNGSAFAGHLVAGGNVFRFRNGGKMPEGAQPLGICKIMGIELTFALPKNAQAKLAERTFATLSRVIDDRPEFKGAHAGHAPGAIPNATILPVPIAKLRFVLQREFGRHNRETGRTAQGARGRSYEGVFHDGFATRTGRTPTARQLYFAGLIYQPVSVDRNGQVRKNGWVYGSYTTQDALLRHHGTGRQILLGRDPDDFSAPAIAFDAGGNLICEGIEAVRPGEYCSVDGIRDAARNRKAARSAVAAADAANNYLDKAAFEAALARLGDVGEPEFVPDRTVISGHFTSPLSDRPGTSGQEIPQERMNEFLRNMDARLAQQRADRGETA